MNTNEIYPEYVTTDIILAAVLKECGISLDRIKIEGKMGIFYFKEVPVETLQNFDTGNLLVEPISFNNAIKALTTAVRRQVHG